MTDLLMMLGGEIIRVMAFWGRDGHYPHWRSEHGTNKWPASCFPRWRPISTTNTKTDKPKEMP